MLRGKRVNFGIHIPPEGKDFATMKELCQTAERLDYDLFTITDHFMNMMSPAEPENHPLECWTTLAALAATTTKIAVGPLVSCVNYRHPTVLAKMATTVDIISKGRLVFGIGAGWHQMEFEGFMGRFPTPRERLDGLEDAIQICRGMFEDATTSYRGKVYSANGTLNSPRPVQESIPIMVGGSGEQRTLKIAAKYADISHLFVNSPKELEHKLQVLQRHCGLIGRDFSEISIAIGFAPILEATQQEIHLRAERTAQRRQIPLEEAERLVQSAVGPDNIVKTIEEYSDLGVDLITFSGIGLEDIGSLRDQVISRLNN